MPIRNSKYCTRESKYEANNYDYVKALSLKSFEMTTGKFPAKLSIPYKGLLAWWSSVTFELRNFFEEWIKGRSNCISNCISSSILNVEELKEVMITNQLESKLPLKIKIIVTVHVGSE